MTTPSREGAPAGSGAPVFGELAVRGLVVPFVTLLVAFTLVGRIDRLPYPLAYSGAISLTLVSMAFGWGAYLRVPFRVGGLALAVGVLGVVLWIGLWHLDRELLGLGRLIGVEREGYDPFESLAGSTAGLWGFLSIRFLGLVLVVPLVEEFFVRGFLMRYMEGANWDARPLGQASRWSVGAVLVYALLGHPAEPLAALAWFGLVTWLYARTRSLWDCVVAHATTNLLLGIYVVTQGRWELW